MEDGKRELTKEVLEAFHEGELVDAYHYFGARLAGEETVFTVWVPDVKRVAVLTETVDGQEDVFSLAPLPEDPSVWQARVPERLEGARYQYRIETAEGVLFYKSDPYAKAAELRPLTRSVVVGDSGWRWSGQTDQQKRQLSENHGERPMAIYELHAGTWRRNERGQFLTYRELADELIPYVKDAGFTHIELLPLTEHPLDESWGYQATGYFAPTSRYGSPDDLRYLVDRCAGAGLGVFLDWIPGHFCSDLFALAAFNGTSLYEETRDERRLNPDWGTMNFDIRRGEVVSFLLSSAHYWLKEFRFDGFRMDALITQLFVPNDASRRQNEEGADFLRKLTASLKREHPDAMLIAEDAWQHPKVTWPVEQGGIGFDYKWNFGWMHDILTYMSASPKKRSVIHGKLNFSLLYQYEERYILAFSHDEVVHGQKSLLNKMPGTEEERFRQLRLLLGYWATHPGKKLLFMGQEFGQSDEWSFQPELDWASRGEGLHRKTALFTKELLAFYRSERALFQLDDERSGFLWLDADNDGQSVASFIRRGYASGDCLIVLCNFSNKDYGGFRVGVPEPGMYEEVFSTEAERYGGSAGDRVPAVSAEALAADGQTQSMKVFLPALSMTVWKKA